MTVELKPQGDTLIGWNVSSDYLDSITPYFYLASKQSDLVQDSHQHAKKSLISKRGTGVYHGYSSKREYFKVRLEDNKVLGANFEWYKNSEMRSIIKKLKNKYPHVLFTYESNLKAVQKKDIKNEIYNWGHGVDAILTVIHKGKTLKLLTEDKYCDPFKRYKNNVEWVQNKVIKRFIPHYKYQDPNTAIVSYIITTSKHMFKNDSLEYMDKKVNPIYTDVHLDTGAIYGYSKQVYAQFKKAIRPIFNTIESFILDPDSFFKQDNTNKKDRVLSSKVSLTQHTLPNYIYINDYNVSNSIFNSKEYKNYGSWHEALARTDFGDSVD